MKKIIFTLALTVFLLTPNAVLAGRGCCSWHGGEAGCSSSGRTICADGTLSPSCTCDYYVPPVYIPPKPRPLNPTTGNWTWTPSADNWCNWDVNMTWSGATNATGYSIAMNKIKGGNPGPLADTYTDSYTFNNMAPGNWYINIKALNSTYGTEANLITYWIVELPKNEPKLEAYSTGNTIHYDFSCLKEVTGPDFLISSMKAGGNYPSGSVEISTIHNNAQTFTFTGKDQKGKSYTKDLVYTPPAPTTVPPQSSKNDNSDDWVLSLMGLVGWIARVFLAER